MNAAELRSELKRWMRANDKRPEDVASFIGSAERTVERFLAGDTIPRPVVMKALEMMMNQSGPTPPRVA